MECFRKLEPSFYKKLALRAKSSAPYEYYKHDLNLLTQDNPILRSQKWTSRNNGQMAVVGKALRSGQLGLRGENSRSVSILHNNSEYLFNGAIQTTILIKSVFFHSITYFWHQGLVQYWIKLHGRIRAFQI